MFVFDVLPFIYGCGGNMDIVIATAEQVSKNKELNMKKLQLNSFQHLL